MKLVSIFAASALILSVPAFAADQLELAKKSGCLACHSVEHKIVGPAYKDVAKKYEGDHGALARLMVKVKKGGSGVWGPVPMPPNPQVSEANLKKIITWVLSLK
ncbi:MAG: c-type cytochrome [Thiobacillaceae bacterium]